MVGHGCVSYSFWNSSIRPRIQAALRQNPNDWGFPCSPAGSRGNFEPQIPPTSVHLCPLRCRCVARSVFRGVWSSHLDWIYLLPRSVYRLERNLISSFELQKASKLENNVPESSMVKYHHHNSILRWTAEALPWMMQVSRLQMKLNRGEEYSRIQTRPSHAKRDIFKCRDCVAVFVEFCSRTTHGKFIRHSCIIT